MGFTIQVMLEIVLIEDEELTSAIAKKGPKSQNCGERTVKSVQRKLVKCQVKPKSNS